MPRYMIQVPFSPDDYIRALKKDEPNAMDLLPEVYWGRMQDRDYGWAVVEAGSEQEALNTIPESLRDKARVCEVQMITPEVAQALQEGAIEKAA